MNTKASVNLPTIDFSRLDFNPSNNPEEWEIVKSQVLKAVEEYGCFKAVSNKISLELRKSIIGVLEELFALPLDTKMKYISETPNGGGYNGKSQFTPLNESLGITDPCALEKVESLTNVLWPEGKSSFSKNIQSYSKQVMEMEKIIRRMILEILGLDKYLEEHINSTNTSLRFMKYEFPNTSDQAEIALPVHIDQDMITILYQNQVGGLEVQSKFNEADWINVELEPDNLIVLIGETFQAWTNGRIYAPRHRVKMSGNKVRYSVGTFTTTKAGYIVKAPEELVDQKHPLLYKPFDFMEVLQRFQADNLFDEDPQMDYPTIKHYFGI